MNNVGDKSAFTTVGDLDDFGGLSVTSAVAFDLLDDIHSLGDFSEDDVLSVEPAGDDGGDEELGSVGVGSSIGHGEESRPGVLELEVLVSELLSVDGLSSGSVVFSEVAALEHELGDDSVEAGSLVAELVDSGAELSEVPGSLGDDIIVKFEDDSASRAAVDRDVEEDV